MIRVLFCCLLIGSFAGAAFHAPWLGLPVTGFVLALWMVGRAQGTIAPTKCTYCCKRVKLGAKACHHCGRQLVAG
jgi:hypothetical protein